MIYLRHIISNKMLPVYNLIDMAVKDLENGDSLSAQDKLKRCKKLMNQLAEECCFDESGKSEKVVIEFGEWEKLTQR